MREENRKNYEPERGCEVCGANWGAYLLDGRQLCEKCWLKEIKEIEDQLKKRGVGGY